MSESRSIEQLLAEIDREVAALPRGSDVASYITRRHRELGEMLAQRVVAARETASKEADFPPSDVPEVRPSGDASGGAASAKDDPPAGG